MKKVLFLLTFILSGIGMATAQTSQISGVVYSEADGEPVIGASVLVVGTDLGAATDIEGKFVIADVPASATTLRVSYMGMATQEVKILRGKTIKVTLTEDGVALDDVMVVAYGTVKKSAFTGSASVVDAEKLEDRQVSNITNALSGTIAGVQTLSSNGQPGTSSTVRIRGIGSLYASNTPLYVVDGIPFDGDISSINPADIESMSVLKDAAAAALYGARGANGVIMVTTKKGKTHDARITFDAKWGVNERQIGKYDVLETADSYMETLYQAYRNAGYYDLGKSAAAAHAYANENLFDAVGYQMYTLNGAPGLIGLDGKVDPLATLGYSDGKYYYTPDDWTAGTIDSQMRQEYNLGVSGGTDRISYYFSAGYLEDGGLIEDSGFDRISTRLNVDYQAKKWLKFGANLAYTNSTSRYPGDQTSSSSGSSANAFNLANQIAPIYPMYFRDVNGNIIRDANSGRPIYDYGNGLGADGKAIPFTRNWMSMSNPVSDLFYNTEEYLMDIMNSKWFAEITPLKGLKLTASLGTHIDNTRYHNVGNAKYGQSASYGGTAMQYHMHTMALNQQYLATYNKTYGKSTYDALVGYEAYDLRYEEFYASGQNLYKDGDFTINNTIDQKRGGGSTYAYSTRGILGRFNYNYDEKYFGSVSYRRDASSRFHPDNRWGNFYSASAAWVLSKEYFMNDVDWVDILKVKASYGQQGNDDIQNYYAYLDQYQVTGADGVFSDGNLVYKGNKDITWEKSNAFNAGVDFSLWKSKLSGTVEYFNRTTSDMLYYKPVAVSNGYTSIPMNIGSMANSGWEIELNATPVEFKKFRWDVYANATFVKNKIIALHPELNGKFIDGSTIYEEGESMYQLYLTKFVGVDPNSGKALYEAMTTADEYLKRELTADEYKELTKEGNEDAYNAAVAEYEKNPEYYVTADYQKAQSTNRQATGDLLPKVYGGFGTSLEFHGFDLSVQFAYQLGGRIWDYSYQDLMHNGDGYGAGQNWHKDIANAWTPENRITDVPRLDYMDQYTNSSSDRWLISSNYLALNNITLGYTFPKAWLRGAGISSLRIFGVADNLAILTARKGMDPRQGFYSSSTATYGAIRTFSAGVKLTF
ncbi:MAG: TonB-dependent receptor [Bacteroidaceae bacterium]|nr:TonB-dependent receptor [Bacteroidaceae bacterium]